LQNSASRGGTHDTVSRNVKKDDGYRTRMVLEKDRVCCIWVSDVFHWLSVWVLVTRICMSMKPAPQEYIITDSDRNYILSHPEDMRTIYGIMERARPYTSASSDVLDDFERWLISKRNVVGSYLGVIEKLKEFRQQTKEHP